MTDVSDTPSEAQAQAQRRETLVAVTAAALSAVLVAKIADVQLALLGQFAKLIAKYGVGDLLLFSLRKAAQAVAARLQQETPTLIARVIAQASVEGGRAGGNPPTSVVGSGGWESHAERSARAIREDLQGKINQATYQITRYADDTYQAVLSDAAQSQVLGLTPAEGQHDAYRKLVREGVTGFTDTRGRNWELSAYVEMATRTAVERAFNVSHLDRMQSLGIDLFVVPDDGHPCALCVAPGTLVSGPAPVGAVRTEYRGDLITIRTALGNELTATPDHTVLTPRGWRRMKELAPGDKVIHDGGQELLASLTVPDNIQVPTRVEDVVKPGLPLLLAGPSGSELNVNIAYREVEVVDPNRVLLSERDRALAEPFGDLLLVPRVGECLACLRERNLSLGLSRPRYTSRSVVSGGDAGFSLLGTEGSPVLLADGGESIEEVLRVESIPGELEAGASASRGDSGAAEVATHGLMADAEGGSELVRAFASKVAADEIVSLEVSEFSGHVWDIQTDQNWYSSNGIISHNCQPWQGKVLSVAPDSRADATIPEATAAGLFHPNCRHVLTAYVPGVTVVPAAQVWSPADQQRYAESQMQRRLEREIRAAKRELAAAYTPQMRSQAQFNVRRAQARMRDFIAQSGRVRNTRREQLNLGAKD